MTDNSFSNESASRSTKKPGQLNSGCGCLFFAVFFLAGSGFFALMIKTLVWPEWRANHSYIAHTCVVLDKRVGESHGDDTTYRPEIHIRYTVRGTDFTTWTYDAAGTYSSGKAGKKEITDRFVVGRQYPCWYDPDNPNKAVLVLGYSWLMYLFLLIPLLFIAIGGGGVYYSWSQHGKSPEQLAAASRKSSSAQSWDPDTATEYPTVPDKDLSGCPGATLKYRLAPSTTPGRQLLGGLIVGAFWNGITSIFVVMAAKSHLEGKADWCMTVFLMPFVAIGLFLIGYCIRQCFIIIGFSTAEAEIDAFPLVAGQAARIQVTQPGPLRLKRMEVLLVCEESASYTQGTDTRTEKKIVHQVTLAEETGVVVSRDTPWEYRGKIEVPRGAMHSFEAKNNKVLWKLLVKGKVELWPNFEWEYPLVVRPATSGGKS